jgi:hypothetical protein
MNRTRRRDIGRFTIREPRTVCSAVAERIDGEPGVAQILADPVGQPNVILHDQHLHRHLHSLRLAG